MHWTTGTKLKACCLDRSELQAWAVEETASAPQYCSVCQPETDASVHTDEAAHLSKLASEILEYVLEAALVHLEIEQPAYRLTVADIAACFGKTPGQISSALHRLLNSGFITVQHHPSIPATIPPKRVVLPTATALRTLEAFRSASDSTIQEELAKLETI